VGMTLMTFAIGGIAFWMPTFLVRTQHLSLAKANMLFGSTTVVAGLIGTLTGGFLGDRLQARHPGGYFLVSGTGLLLGAPLALAMPYLPDARLIFACAFAAEVLLFLNTGPLNAALVASIPAGLRASAVALNVLLIHLLGDALSPWLLGEVSESAGLAQAVALTAMPIAIGGAALLWGSQRVRRWPGGLAAVDGVEEAAPYPPAEV